MNWFLQSSSVDFYDMYKIEARLSYFLQDELRYIVKDDVKYKLI